MQFKMKQVSLDDATEDQIHDYCETLDLQPGNTRDRLTLLALLQQAWNSPFIVVPDVEEMPDQIDRASRVPQQRMEGGTGDSDPKVVVRIGTAAGPGGTQPVPVSVNGRTVIVQRNLDVEMPYRYFLALRQAVRAEVSQDERTNDLIETQVRNYPMDVIRMPTSDEIAAWHERVDSQLMPA